ncbi:DUF1330 domain-containing protein [Pyruvatibacter sp.]|uniref:DUF1330 domain-containing protein n=1 Tax=unclassified Pyruvatibacter TaxID=2618840 RepID=UPI002967DD81|nr:DUF1330 domain-containing protein [Alphaproteobacteria bacterium]
MTVYAIVSICIHDRPTYDRYASRFFEVFSKFDGRLLVSDEHPELLMGDWPYDKLIMMSFPDADAYYAWAHSPEYLEIAKDREAATVGTGVLVKGLAPAAAVG